MDETKHFSYEANVELKTNRTGKYEIKDIVFLTPARVTFVTSQTEYTEIVSVDFVNKKVYESNSPEPSEMSEAFFAHLDTVNSLPENFYEAPPEVVEQAVEMQAEQVRIKEQIGVTNE